jgi:DNA primase
MDLETIKSSYPMRDILDRLNISINRSGFCKCPFHKEDTASMKVYESGYYCFGCNKGGDIVDFVQSYHGLDFRDACKWISGEELSLRSDIQISAANIRRLKHKEKENRLRQELRQVNEELTGLWNKYLIAKPLSDEQAKTYNKWQILVYKQETIFKELGAT